MWDWKIWKELERMGVAVGNEVGIVGEEPGMTTWDC